MAVPMNQVDDARGRPGGVIEMVGVGNDQLFEVDHVCNKEKVEEKEYNECNIKRSL
jgi:hypothetical protein